MENEKKFTPADMPQKDAFKQKEVYQHPQPADTGKALDKADKKDNPLFKDKEENKTEKEEGLNEASSSGNAGAFEGFEDQQNGID